MNCVSSCALMLRKESKNCVDRKTGPSVPASLRPARAVPDAPPDDRPPRATGTFQTRDEPGASPVVRTARALSRRRYSRRSASRWDREGPAIDRIARTEEGSEKQRADRRQSGDRRRHWRDRDPEIMMIANNKRATTNSAPAASPVSTGDVRRQATRGVARGFPRPASKRRGASRARRRGPPPGADENDPAVDLASIDPALQQPGGWNHPRRVRMRVARRTSPFAPVAISMEPTRSRSRPFVVRARIRRSHWRT